MNRRQRRIQQRQPKPKQLTVVFCLPGNKFSDNFLKSWTNLFSWCLQNNINPIYSTAYDSNVYYARQKVLGPNVKRGKYQKPFDGKLDYDYLMWIDSDMVFRPEDFVELLNMDKEIASGIYKMSDSIHYATVENWDKDYYVKNGNFQFLNDTLLANKPPIFPVEYTGFGWMLIKKGVLESMEYPWFRPLWEDYGNNIVEFCSEDVGFCQTAITKGYKIYVNKNARVGHEKSWIL